MAFVALLWIISLAVHSLCVPVNVSIDDTLGDEVTGNMITYSDGWKLGQNCSDCTAIVDASQAFDHTWHDGTYLPISLGGTGQLITATVSFTGNAFYVMCILTHSDVSPDGNTDMVFLLDGVQVGTLEEPPTNDTTYHYNQVVFNQTGLTLGPHTIRIEVGHNDTKALILLDRIIYTSEVSNTTSSMQLPPLTITEANPSSTPTSSASAAPSSYSVFVSTSSTLFSLLGLSAALLIVL